MYPHNDPNGERANTEKKKRERKKGRKT